MTAPIRLADGRPVHYRERIPAAGAVVGLSRPSSFRAAERESWPMTGESGGRWVLMVPFLESQGIPFTIEETAGVEEDPDTSGMDWRLSHGR